MSVPYACMPIGAVLMILTSIEVIYEATCGNCGIKQKGGVTRMPVLIVIILLLVLSFGYSDLSCVGVLAHWLP